MRPAFPVPLRNAISAVFLTTLAAVAPAQEVAWASHGPTDLGWVNDLAIADSTAYAATLNGVFRSDDGGASWQPSGLTGKSILQIAARHGTSTVVALLWGVWPSPNLYVSQDSGQTWTSVPGQDSAIVVGIDPDRPSTVYTGSADDGSIWKSTDAGATWQKVWTPSVNNPPLALAVGSDAVYILTTDNFYKSADGGLTWSSVQPPGTAGFRSISAIAVGSAARVVYAAGVTGFCRSADSASTWTCSASRVSSASRIVEVPAAGTPTPRLLAATSDGVLLSEDGGATWAPAGSGLETSIYAALASDASGSLVLAGTGTQAFRSLDRGDTWRPAATGLNSVWIGALALDPHDPSTVWAGGQSNDRSGPGLFHSINAGGSWSRAGGPEGPSNVYTLALDPDHPTTLYAGEGAVFRTHDGGQSWTSSAPDGSGYWDVLAIDPSAPQRILAGSGSGLFRSEDGAETWEPPSITQAVYCLLFDDQHPGTIYAGSDWDVNFDYYGSSGGSIWKSTDHGATFTKGAFDFPDWVRALARDPFQDGVLYAGTASTGAFRSADGGVTWEGASTGLSNAAPRGPAFLYSPVNQLVADPVRPGYLYCATLSGVFRTTNGARTWEFFSNGLAPLSTEALAISPDGRRLYAGTQGGGVFELDLEADVTPFTCSPSASRLCLVGGRYAVDLIATLPGHSQGMPGAARPLSDRSGYFGLPFATGDPDLPEVVVKMLPDGTFGSSGAPVFYSSLTTLPYYLTVIDRLTGEQRSYVSTPGSPLCGGADIPRAVSETSASPRSTPKAEAATLSLLGGRFLVTLEARRPGSAALVHGVAMASGDRFGFLSLPEITGDATFPEVVVKMIDARAFDGNFWFFHTGLTSLAYTLTVMDSVTGEVRTYESPGAFCGGVDTNAFTSGWDY